MTVIHVKAPNFPPLCREKTRDATFVDNILTHSVILGQFKSTPNTERLFKNTVANMSTKTIEGDWEFVSDKVSKNKKLSA